MAATTAMAMAMALLLLVGPVAIDSVQANLQERDQMCGVPGGEPGDGATKRRVIDITHALRADMPSWESEQGLGKLTGLVQSMADGDVCNVSELKLEAVHSGTHVDAPGHYVQEHYEAGLDVASLSLDILIGKLPKFSPVIAVHRE